jgi:hypothetical protein
MTLGGTDSGSLAEDCCPSPPSLETRTIRGFRHFHSDDGGLLTATTSNPTKIGVASITDSCTDSCNEQDLEAKTNLVA